MTYADVESRVLYDGYMVFEDGELRGHANNPKLPFATYDAADKFRRGRRLRHKPVRVVLVVDQRNVLEVPE